MIGRNDHVLRRVGAAEYQLRLLVESMVAAGRDEEDIASAVRAADDRPRVLVAEDETLVRMDIGTVLQAAGFDVCAEAADGREAIALALEHEPDAILMDANMPRLDGVAAAEAILAARRVPIVMLTGYDYGELIDRALAAGISHYLVKPFAERDVVAALEAAMSSDAAGRLNSRHPSKEDEA
jgi:DNA-binding NarL/FixJ family response regulator